MKTFKGSTLVVASILLVLAAQGTAAGPTTTVSTVYTVGVLTVPGVNTGLVLRKGDSGTVTAAGTVCYWQGPPAVLCVDPDGEPSLDTSTLGGFVQPDAPAIGLIGRVGTGPWVHVGSSGTTTLSGRGVLVFAVNDNYFPDNTGSFEVTVTHACKPGWGWGDKNHRHCGPPGLDNKPSSPGQSSGATRGSSGEHTNSQGNSNGNSNPPGNANGHNNPPGNASGKGTSGRP